MRLLGGPLVGGVVSRISLTTATAHYLRARGWVGDSAERRQGPISHDFLGWADSVWIQRVPRPRWCGSCPDPTRVLGVQHTDHTNASKRLAKMRASPGLMAWLAQGGEAWLIAWGPKGPVVTVVEMASVVP